MDKKILPFIVFWLVDTILLYLFYLLFPAFFVLGNTNLSPIMGAILSGIIWTAIVWISEPLLSLFNLKLKGSLQQMSFYLLVNFVALWFTARLASTFGFGVYNFIWVLLLSFVANYCQYIAWKYLKFPPAGRAGKI